VGSWLGTPPSPIMRGGRRGGRRGTALAGPIKACLDLGDTSTRASATHQNLGDTSPRLWPMSLPSPKQESTTLTRLERGPVLPKFGRALPTLPPRASEVVGGAQP